MKILSFESFLEEHWMDNLAEGQSKDASISATERWMEGLDVAELIELGNKYGERVNDLADLRCVKQTGL